MIQREDYYNFNQFTHEFALELNETILKSKNKLVLDTIIKISKSEYYYHVTMFIDTLKNYLYFNDKTILKKYLLWRYRVYFFRKIDFEFILIEAAALQKLVKFYVEDRTFVNIKHIFEDIKENHLDYIKATKEDTKPQYTPLIDQLFSYAINGESEKLYTSIAHNANSIEDLAIFIDQQLSQVLIRIGKEWEEMKISIAQEHLASTTIESVLEKIFDRYMPIKSKNKTILIATGMKEYHKLGIMIGKNILNYLGYKVINFGSDLPLSELRNLLYDLKPNYVISSVTLISHLDKIDLLVQDIKKDITFDNVEFIIAGHAITYLKNPEESLSYDRVINKYQTLYKRLY